MSVDNFNGQRRDNIKCEIGERVCVVCLRVCGIDVDRVSSLNDKSASSLGRFLFEQDNLIKLDLLAPPPALLFFGKNAIYVVGPKCVRAFLGQKEKLHHTSCQK